MHDPMSDREAGAGIGQDAGLPLSGVLVVDMSRVLAGPWCTQILADLGATVVKVERPRLGDDTRHWGPPFHTDSDGSRGDAAYFLAANRGKRSIEIDVSKREGSELVRKLALRADVFVENFKTGDLARFQLDYKSLAALNERLVYASITGFGQTGPDRSRPGYDLIIQAMSGLMSITGRRDDEPGSGPLKVGVAVSDLFAGLYTTIGVLAALRERESSGRGQHVDISLYDSQVAVLANQAMNYLVGGEPPGRLGNAHPNIVPYESFPTLDGEMVIASGNDSQFRALCGALDMEEAANDAQYSTNADRVRNRVKLVERISARTRIRPTRHWIEALDRAGVPCGPIRTLDQVFDAGASGSEAPTRELGREIGDSVPTLPNPIRLSRTKLDDVKAPPRLGEDTMVVLEDLLGLGREASERLLIDGIVANSSASLRSGTGR